MMGAAKSAYRSGQRDQAFNAAVCCQVHNRAAQACLASHKDAVFSWFDSH
jgi:hypothetical protein